MKLVTALRDSSKKRLLEPHEIDRDRALKQELEAAKQILAEIFSVRPYDVDDMIIKRIESRCDSDPADYADMSRLADDRKRLEEGSNGSWGTWPEMLQVE